MKKGLPPTKGILITPGTPSKPSEEKTVTLGLTKEHKAPESHTYIELSKREKGEIAYANNVQWHSNKVASKREDYLDLTTKINTEANGLFDWIIVRSSSYPRDPS